MDTIYDYLKADHDKVKKLFKLFEDAPSSMAKLDYVIYLIKELLLHAEAEAATFYKALEQFPDSKELALHGEKEHVEIENKISEILSINKYDKNYDNKILELKELVEHHVSDEEGKIFKKEIFSDKDAYILREKMHDMKEKLLTKIEAD